MHIHQFLQPLAGAIGLVAYIVIIVGIFKANVKQSFAAFMLWAMLDSIATVTSVIEQGNYWLPFSNALGSTTIAILLAIRKQISWSRIETLTLILVILCLIVWFVAGEQAGIIVSSLAVVIASIPQMKETYAKPEATPVNAYIIFLLGNFVAFFAGKSWSIEERFYPACSVFLCVVIVVLALRNKKVITN